MKKLVLMAVNTWRSRLLLGLQLMACIALILGTLEPVHAADFFCSSGNVTCLIAAINSANGMPGEHVINLEPGIYTLQAQDNITDGANGLPSIMRSIRIQASADDPPTVIEGDSNNFSLRIFHVSLGGELTLDGLVVQRGGSLGGGGAILNRGTTSLVNTVITDIIGEAGGIRNFGTLSVVKSRIIDNNLAHHGGAIDNEAGNVLVESSTIAHNVSTDGGAILNLGSLTVRNSSLIFNSADFGGVGGGIHNSGTAEVVNSTIAKNGAGVSGAGIRNAGGLMSIINSTIRENTVFTLPIGRGDGIQNDGGIVQLQNTIVAGNIVNAPLATGGFDCAGVITSLGNNFIGDPSGCDINLQPSDLTGDPGLGALTGTGEDDLPGRAHYPVLAGSPVIDKGNPNACLQTDQLGILRVGTCDIGAVEFRGPALVSIDIRPKKDANRINPSSIKKINVAVFSINGFDATAVSANTVRFGATGIEAAPIHGAIRDVDGDGHFDMFLTFEIQNTGIRCGDTSASLTGQTSSGVSFIGSSPIKTVQCKTPQVSRR